MAALKLEWAAIWFLTAGEYASAGFPVGTGEKV